VNLQVLDSAGRTVLSLKQEGLFGPNTVSLDVSPLKEGIYHLHMIHKGKRTHGSFMKL
jgi:hypothetical protein